MGTEAASLGSDLLRMSLSAWSPRRSHVKFLTILDASPWGRLQLQFCYSNGSQSLFFGLLSARLPSSGTYKADLGVM